MCQKCFTRSAIILAAVMTGAPVPPEKPEDRHDDDKLAPWDGKVVDTIQAAVVAIGDHAKAVPPGETMSGDCPAFDKIFTEGLAPDELLSFAALCEAFKRHFGSFAKVARAEFGSRVEAGDPAAVEITVRQATGMTKDMLGESGARVIGAFLSDLIKSADRANGKGDPNLN